MNQTQGNSFKAWVLYCDIFGFSARLLTENLTYITDRLREGHQIIHDASLGSDIIYFRVISDSIFVIFKVSDEQCCSTVLQTCVEFTEMLCSKFADLELPIRGGIAYGEIYIDETILLGEAVMRAVRYESLISGPFVILPKKELHCLRSSEMPKEIRYIRGKNRQLINGVLLLPHPLDPLMRLAQKYVSELGEKGPWDMCAIWYDVLDVIRGD